MNDLTHDTPLPALPSEQLLIDWLPDWECSEALVISPGRAQVADVLVERGVPRVTAWYYDLHQASSAAQACRAEVEVQCAADLPDEPVDLVAMPVLQRGEAELTRELLQQAHQRLVEGGHLIVSVDNPKDQWLHQQLQGMFDKVTCHRDQLGCVYWGTKTKPLKKLKDFSCQFAFRDDEQRLIQVLSRPGVFSHRRLDPGARQLMLSAEIAPTDNVLELGCGSGAVSFAAAFQTNGAVYAVDANARAIECTQRGVELNGLDNVQCILNAAGGLEIPAVDIALANPPYFGNDAISRHFVDTAVAALRPGGALLVVTKRPSWYEDYFAGLLDDLAVIPAARYFVVCGRQR